MHEKDGNSGLQTALAEPFDAAIIDILLPLRDGLSLIREMRLHHVTVPVIILSAKRSVQERIEGLRSGSDDYLTKPFSFSELLARVQALTRRTRGAPEPTTLAYVDLSLNLLTREVRRTGRDVVGPDRMARTDH